MKYIMMGISSNFGNMFSVAGASLLLPLLGLSFLPMLPIQILLNNLLYDISQTTITTDNVDPEYVEKPKRWDIGYIRNFMIYLGPVSYLYDFLNFFIMMYLFLTFVPVGPAQGAQQASLFQTAWFLESLITQALVIFVIRTRKSPFWKSKPSKLLVISSFSIVVAALIIPYTVLGAQYFSFVHPPPMFFVYLIGLVVAYMVLAEVVKRFFYQRHAYRIEQVLIPKRRPSYLSRNARLVQNIAAVICLRPEHEISFDSLLEDLSRTTQNYPVDSDQVFQNLQHLRRGGLIAVDWHSRVIKREGPIKEYVMKRVAASEMWPMVIDDWLRISRAIQEKYGSINPEFQDLLSPKMRR
jgi:hypothetical protein